MMFLRTLRPICGRYSPPLVVVFIASAMFLCCLGTHVDADDTTLAGAKDFLSANCFDCHQGEEAEAGLDLEKLTIDLASATTTSQWVRVFDRVHEGEMPPADYGELNEDKKSVFLESVGEAIRDKQLAERKEKGRVLSRRLTRKQVERSLHDVLGIDIPLAEYLPEESRQGRYSTVADGQAMSHFQMQAHLSVVDRALDEAFRRAFSPADDFEYDFAPREIARRRARQRCREPEMRNGKAVIWNGGVTFYGRIPAAAAPEDGWYRFSLTVSALKPPKNGGVWSSIRSGLCVSSAPLLTHVTAFEATPEPKEIEFEVWLPKDHMLEIRPADATLKKGSFKGGQIGAGEGEPQNIPGIAFHRLKMKRIHQVSDDDGIRQRLFGKMQIKDDIVLSDHPNKDAEQLLLDFASRAFRRPVERTSVASYLDATLERIANGDSFADAVRFGYRAILCSPRFLYFAERPGTLDPHAVASRLSYFLTGSCPDEKLRSLADSGELANGATLNEEVDRLLNDQGEAFVADFAAEWLDLDKLNDTVPDRKLYPKFDAVVGALMLEETHAYLEDMLESNESVTGLVDGDFTFLNSRLGRYYGIDGVEGDALKKVSLAGDSPRGGLLTQGAILKVTANGTNTSPVLRGVWICERLLGVHIPPPPDNVPAIEPDVRGATTIREQLKLHRSNDACASCHRKIDPSGFALENFDAAGQWREFYHKPKGRKGRKKIKVDASYKLADGRTFSDIRDFRKLVVDDKRRLAANVVENLLVFGTGGPIEFADREVVEAVVEQAAEDDFGFRTIVKSVVASQIFLEK